MCAFAFGYTGYFDIFKKLSYLK